MPVCDMAVFPRQSTCTVIFHNSTMAVIVYPQESLKLEVERCYMQMWASQYILSLSLSLLTVKVNECAIMMASAGLSLFEAIQRTPMCDM